MNIQRNLQVNYKIYKEFEDILNSYVSDYYLENHWEKLPKSWQNHFSDIEMKPLSQFLNFSIPTRSLEDKIYPLALLCLRELVIRNSIPRSEMKLAPLFAFKTDDDFMNFFWKNVKLKKRHEITRLAQKCYESAEKTNCFHIVDVGSGLGHLSRMMAFGYGLKVCTFEADESLSKQAQELDRVFKNKLDKRNILYQGKFETVHLNHSITRDFVKEKFLQEVIEAFGGSSDLRFGIVGLHPCGDLGSLLLKLYSDCSNITFINMASCCYMRMTLEPAPFSSFPMSKYCSDENYMLSYLSCEIACHSIETYAEKLSNSEEYNKLKIHSYRALLEKILVSIDPKLGHSMVPGVKYKEDLTFSRYIEKVMQKMNINPPQHMVSLCESLMNKTWKKVIVFYSLRLFLAPLVETIILLDRLLFLKEQGSDCAILPLFDCTVSPRNQVITGSKINAN
nr:protein RRNAD1 [Leptinotarsa decemlineata]